MNNHTETLPPQNPRAPGSSEAGADDRARLERRHALLRGLGKGSALVAMAAPLQSYAARVITTNGTGCTVAGNQSAPVSQPAGAVVCSAFVPSHFIAKTTYSPIDDTAQTALGMSKATFKTFKSSLAGTVMPGTGCIGIKNSDTLCAKLAPSAWPSSLVGLLATAAFNSIFTTSTNLKTALQVLSENGDDAYFLAAYFSASLPGKTLPFDGTYVKAQYTTATYANAVTFFRLVCTRA